MSDQEFLQLKKSIYDYCDNILKLRISELRNNMAEIQNSANSDTKSSMGDKYETSRAMAMIEKDNFAKQLEQLGLQKKVLDNLNPDTLTTKVGLGSLVKTESGMLYYVSIGMGKVDINGTEIFVISPVSPLGKSMQNLSQGDIFELNGRAQQILKLA